MLASTRALLCQAARTGVHQFLERSQALFGSTSLLHKTSYSIASLPKLDGQTVVKLNSVSDHEPYTLTKEQECLITGGNSEKGQKLSELMLKLYVKRQQDVLLPDEVRIEDIEIMLDLGAAQLNRLLRHLNKRCYAKRKKQDEREVYNQSLEVVREERKIAEPTIEHPWLQYTLHRNGLFPRIYKGSMQQLYDVHTAYALHDGQKVVIDCSYQTYMNDHAIKLTAKQIILCYFYNRRTRRPFAMHLCNLKMDDRLLYYLQRLHPNIEKEGTIGIHNSSYTDIFDRKNLVYLSPHASRLLSYNPNDIYVLGGIVDKSPGLQISNKKAAKEKIRCASLPLNHYVEWKKGNKSLCIHQVFNSLLVVKNTSDWSKALLENVPRRKIHEDPENSFDWNPET